jgi:hypothetical protein
LLNRNKTEGVWIGKLKNCKYKIAGINWTDKPIKSLGIYFGNNNEESLFFDRRCSANYFFRNVNKMAAWIPDNKKR